MERMTGLDATFLYLETPEQPMVINAIIELDVSEEELARRDGLLVGGLETVPVRW